MISLSSTAHAEVPCSRQGSGRAAARNQLLSRVPVESVGEDAEVVVGVAVGDTAGGAETVLMIVPLCRIAGRRAKPDRVR